MDFDINLRVQWLPRNPPVKIKPGEFIKGPEKFLENYRFLRKIPIKMHEVSGVTQQQDGSYQDIGEDSDEIIHISENDVVEYDNSEEISDKKEFTQEEIETWPFNPYDDVNWFKIKVDELEIIAKKLDIDISEYEELKKKDKRWPLVGLIKKAVGKEVK